MIIAVKISVWVSQCKDFNPARSVVPSGPHIQQPIKYFKRSCAFVTWVEVVEVRRKTNKIEFQETKAPETIEGFWNVGWN